MKAVVIPNVYLNPWMFELGDEIMKAKGIKQNVYLPDGYC